MPLLGNVAEIQNFPMSHQDLSMERLATRGRRVYLHTLEDRETEALKNVNEGVVHEAIQIATESDLSTEQWCLRVQHTCSSVTSPAP